MLICCGSNTDWLELLSTLILRIVLRKAKMMLLFLFLINSIMQLGLIMNKKNFRFRLVLYSFMEPIVIICFWIANKLIEPLSATEIYAVILIAIVTKFVIRWNYKRKTQNIW